MSEFVNIKDKTVYIPNNDVIVEEIEKYMGHDFSEFIRKHFEAYEAENEHFRDALNEILSIVQQYQYSVEYKNEPFSRKQVFKLLENICDLIENMI